MHDCEGCWDPICHRHLGSAKAPASPSFAAAIAANDREHVEKLEDIEALLRKVLSGNEGLNDYAARACAETTMQIAADWLPDELARWRRPHPMGER